MRLIETSNLKVWAASRPAQGRLPYWVKELICAVVPPRNLRFPSGTAVWVPGPDGLLLSEDQNRFVPTGWSVWEMGTEEDAKAKATKDYDKRSGGEFDSGKIAHLNRTECTFVFVTPRVWRDKGEWAAERRKVGIWRDVVVMDGVDLQEWLEQASAVSLRFAAELGFTPEEGLQTLDQAWEDWRHLSDPPASERLVLAGREEEEQELMARLMDAPETFTVRGDSPREALGFALAVLKNAASAEDAPGLEARTIIADDEKVANKLQNRRNLIILLKETKEQVSGYLSARGFHQIVPEGTDAHSQRNLIVLRRPTHYEFVEALEGMGMDPEEAEKASRACGRSVTVFQRLRAPANFRPPAWADREAATKLLPALLAGRWNSKSAADQQALCQLADTDNYAQIEGELQEYLLIDEAPLQKIDELWTMTAPVDAFQLAAGHLTTIHLDRFRSVFRSVFGRIDPKVEMTLTTGCTTISRARQVIRGGCVVVWQKFYC